MDTLKDTTRAAVTKAIQPLHAHGFALGYKIGPQVEITIKRGVAQETYTVTKEGHAMIDCSDVGTFGIVDREAIRAALAGIARALNQAKEETPAMDYQEARTLAFQTTSISHSTTKAIEAKEEEIRATQREVSEWNDKIGMEELNIPITGSNDTERKANKAKAIADNPTIQALKSSKSEAEKRVGQLTSELHSLYRKHRIEVKEIELVIALLHSKSGIAEDPQAAETPVPTTAPTAVELF